jgi:hypothetical protein
MLTKAVSNLIVFHYISHVSPIACCAKMVLYEALSFVSIVPQNIMQLENSRMKHTFIVV